MDAYIGLNLAMEYCMQNDLVFNQAKTKQVVFGNRREDLPCLPSIESASSIKHLGVTVDETLSWNEHVDSLCYKLSSAIFAIKRTIAISTPQAALTAYYALFESHLRYGIAVWGGSSKQNLNRVLVVQKRALRVMAGLRALESCRPIFKSWRVLTVVNIYIHQAIMVANSLGIPRHQEVHGYGTRHVRDYSLQAHRLKLFEEKPSYAGAKLFNHLPPSLKTLDHKRLKTGLKSWLGERPFYSVEEFLDWKRQEVNSVV